MSDVEAFGDSVVRDVRKFAKSYGYDDVAIRLRDDGLEITLSDSANPEGLATKFAVAETGTYRQVGDAWEPVDA
ncbi:hypothetical protein RBWH47_01293 [Rhodopirellula baltica WH47]|uniref:Uncharacterized protein n=1 Tax=Rhodopirellula baltica WH47 TaxID=991778 RepID=F2AQ14_RHOBT|nr:hypothetical protein RBWH47_01293 [Rhodopirellula baltica WH47]